MKNWMADKAGIPVGDQYLLGIIMGLFTQGEALLGLLLLVFSVGFPLTKVALMVWLSSVGPASAPRPFRLLKLTSKWSMTDVFVVALLITFFKAESFNFHFEAELGVYLFAAGAILSSLGVHLLERAKGPAGSGPGAVA